ncbi:MAG: hypothetical protein KQH63_11710 [Desulfobulbaceae bacterium]|nr:hypothetical protein [Desulfobulbaceae bacterium]
MLRYCAFVGVLWFLLRVNPEFEPSYNLITEYLANHQGVIGGWIFLVCLCLIGLTYLFDVLGLHSLMMFIVKFAFEISQAAVCTVTFGAMLLYADMGIIMWKDLGFATLLPLLTLLASLCCFRLFDFNYSIRGTFATTMILPFLSAIFFGIIMLSGNQ